MFPDPPDTTGIGTTSLGVKVTSRPFKHHTGRIGIAYDIPDNTPLGQGFEFTLFHPPPRVNITQKGILWLRVPGFQYPWDTGQEAALAMDDFRLPIVETHPIPPPSDRSPEEIIHDVYATGLYNLTTHDGCGVFTEACCSALHDNHSPMWGHIKKIGAQEQYNGHAIDAVQLLNSMPDCERGVYDIIIQSQAPDARPSFNLVGPPNQLLWYYPA